MKRTSNVSTPPRKSAQSASVAGAVTVKYVVVVGFAVAVLVIAGLGFSYKMTEFAQTIATDEVEGFGIVAVSVYLIGMLPIVFVTLWALMSGRFRDIERPKFRMLEIDEEITRAGGERYTVEQALRP